MGGTQAGEAKPVRRRQEREGEGGTLSGADMEAGRKAASKRGAAVRCCGKRPVWSAVCLCLCLCHPSTHSLTLGMASSLTSSYCVALVS